MNVRELANSEAEVKCRSFECKPKWRVFIGETTWKDGSPRQLVSLTCHNFRYLDLEAMPVALVERAHGS